MDLKRRKILLLLDRLLSHLLRVHLAHRMPDGADGAVKVHQTPLTTHRRSLHYMLVGLGEMGLCLGRYTILLAVLLDPTHQVMKPVTIVLAGKRRSGSRHAALMLLQAVMQGHQACVRSASCLGTGTHSRMTVNAAAYSTFLQLLVARISVIIGQRVEDQVQPRLQRIITVEINLLDRALVPTQNRRVLGVIRVSQILGVQLIVCRHPGIHPGLRQLHPA